MNSHNQFQSPQSLHESLGGLPPGFAPAAPQTPQHAAEHHDASMESHPAAPHRIPVQRHPEAGRAIEVPVTRWVDTGRVATISQIEADADRAFPEEAGMTSREKREAWLNAKFGEGLWDLQEVPFEPQEGRSLHTPGASNSNQLQSHLGTEPAREPQYKIRVKDDPKAPWNQ